MTGNSIWHSHKRYFCGASVWIVYTAAVATGFNGVLLAASPTAPTDTQLEQAKQAQATANQQVPKDQPGEAHIKSRIDSGGKPKVGDSDQREDQAGWKPLLGKDLEGWTMTDFFRPGKVSRQGDIIIFEEGTPLTGITTERKDFPTENFEIELQARRVTGNDFLCGLTFPVGKGFCTFIAGGWGGGLIGLSSVDGSDASENQTTGFHEFENGKWYKFKVSVDDQLVRGWIDGKEIFSQEREGRDFSTRIEVFACQPLGLCAFQSKVEIKDFRWRPLSSQ